jgi:hypothetical protein
MSPHSSPRIGDVSSDNSLDEEDFKGKTCEALKCMPVDETLRGQEPKIGLEELKLIVD